MNVEKKNASEVLAEVKSELSLIRKLSEDNNNLLKILVNKINLQQRNKPEPKEEFDFHEAEVKTPTVSAPVETNVNSTIEQTVLYKSSQKPVSLAEIKVTNIKTGTLIYKTVTNTSGKWTGSLEPGNYRVDIKKGPIQTESAFMTTLKLEVDGSGKPILLGRKLV